MSANTEDLYDGSLDGVVELEGLLNEVGSVLDAFPAVASDEEYAMDGLLELAPPVWFVVVWVGWSGLLTTGVAKEFGVGNLAECENTRFCFVIVHVVEPLGDTEFLETSAGESDVGANHWDQAGETFLLVVSDGVTVVQDLGAGGDQRE